MWHSLDENGKIEIYDVQWADGTVETNIPVGLLEGVKITEHGNTKKEGAHGVQRKDTPVHERKYKGKMMKITKNELRRIIKEEKAKLQEMDPASVGMADPGPVESAASSAFNIASGLRKGLLTPESAADRIENEIKKVLYDYLRRIKGR